MRTTKHEFTIFMAYVLHTSLPALCSFGPGISNLEYSVLVSTIKPADVNALQAINQI